jgi:hypothetical protein
MFDPHPYEVLAVSPNAGKAEVLKAFAKALQQRRYPPDILAKARKSLVDPLDRVIAHYLWGSWQQADTNSETNPAVLELLQAEIDRLEKEIQVTETVNQLTAEMIQSETMLAKQILSQNISTF